MAEVKWVKLTTDMFDNRKVKHLRRLPEGNNIVLIWVMLLTMAGRCNSGGMIFLTENIPYTPKMLADELDFEENTVLLALQALEQLDMIVTDNGFFTIAGWEEYQNIEGMDKIREQNRLRKQRQREKQKLLEGVSRDGHGTITGCHAIEEEEEEDKEKEFHSFIQSAEGEEDLTFPTYHRKYYGKDKLVMLSEEQIGDLLEKMSLDEFDRYFDIVESEERKGHHYKKKTHYQAILEMAMKDHKVEKKG